MVVRAASSAWLCCRASSIAWSSVTLVCGGCAGGPGVCPAAMRVAARMAPIAIEGRHIRALNFEFIVDPAERSRAREPLRTGSLRRARQRVNRWVKRERTLEDVRGRRARRDIARHHRHDERRLRRAWRIVGRDGGGGRPRAPERCMEQTDEMAEGAVVV